MERLRKEFFNLSGSVNSGLILFGKFLHTKDGNDILKFLILLQIFLHMPCNLVMLFTHNILFQITAVGLQRIHSRVDTFFRNLSGKNGGCVKVRESGGRGGVRKVIRRNIDRLHGSNRTVFGGGNSFLKPAYVRSKGGLIAYRGRHSAKQRRHF